MAPLPSAYFDSYAALLKATNLQNLAKRIPLPSAELLAIPKPTPTVQSLWTRVLAARQTTGSIIPASYGSINSGPSAGTVVGIVLGSVAGFLLLLWLIYTCLNFGTWGNTSEFTEEVVVQRDRRKSHRGSQRSRRASETVEIRRDRTPVPIVHAPSPRRTETIIVEEDIRQERKVPSRSRENEEVVVIEEHSPPRRKKSHRDRERGDINSGFRTVDPSSFGGVVGGNARRNSGRR